jgi:regulator of RNase E activity RraB
MENKRNTFGEPINPTKNTNLKYIVERARDVLDITDGTIATNDTKYCLEAVELLTEALEKIEKIAVDAIKMDI